MRAVCFDKEYIITGSWDSTIIVSFLCLIYPILLVLNNTDIVFLIVILNLSRKFFQFSQH